MYDNYDGDETMLVNIIMIDFYSGKDVIKFETEKQSSLIHIYHTDFQYSFIGLNIHCCR